MPPLRAIEQTRKRHILNPMLPALAAPKSHHLKSVPQRQVPKGKAEHDQRIPLAQPFSE